ncbi:50S ribosomal protein L24 [Candidatus Pacearchaeota archaeon]|nr:50S ribosomal protein L24 [Candidatus Pacearchaeota archaeon]
MKQIFSKSWKGSKQPRKQRKHRFNAPMNVRRKMMASNLSKELRKKYGKRSFPVVKGDNVKILRGEFKGKIGRVDKINYKKFKITIDGVYRTKKDGSKVPVLIHPSKVQIKELHLEDSKRKKALERKMIKKDETKKSYKNKEGKVK